MTKSLALPRHIAIVMDGNGRWASKRFMPRLAGHKQGVEVLKNMVRTCVQRKIEFLTVFAFSSENWSRSATEVSGLMDLLAMALSREVAQLSREGVGLRFVGSRVGLSERVCRGLDEAEAATAHNTRIILSVCFNYGGRWDIVNAAANLTKSGVPITEESMTGAMSLAHCPDPDLIIRTGGEMRLSNFLLWQSAYAELYFTEVLWPDFDAVALDLALHDFSNRERRFGITSNPVALPLVINP
jgi:undecaprenyl diphosphate synthase